MVDQIARLPRTAASPFQGFSLDSVRRGAEAILIPVGALLATAIVFGLFVAAAGADPLETYSLMYRGAFGTWFSW
jgi:general nucleoside transport system permease protein